MTDTLTTTPARTREEQLHSDAARAGLALRKMADPLPGLLAGPFWLAEPNGWAVAGEPWHRSGLALAEAELAVRHRLTARSGGTPGN